MPSRLNLRAKTHLGGNIWAFTFEPDTPLSWQAGQAIRIELPHASPDAGGTKRHFTITSAPFERVITITTRLTASSFKQALAALPVGGEVTLLEQPAGTFAWPEPDTATDPTRPVVLVAQGIGITPFVSLLRQRRHEGKSLAATLVHTNLSQPIPFRAELEQLAAAHPEFKLFFEPQPPTVEQLLSLEPNLSAAHVLIAGPRPFFELLGPPVSLPAGHYHYDQFTGYAAKHY